MSTTTTCNSTMSVHPSSSAQPPANPIPAKFRNRRAKVVLLGSAGVGKTSLLNRQNEEFDANVSETVGAGFALATVLLPNGSSIELQVWDTAGQERYRSMAPLYYRNADGALVVYDVTNRQSFEAVKKWVNELVQFVGSDICIVVVGNKIDLESNRVVTADEGREYAVNAGNLFAETSAFTGEGVSSAFQSLSAKMLGLEHAAHVDNRGFDVSFRFEPTPEMEHTKRRCAC